MQAVQITVDCNTETAGELDDFGIIFIPENEFGVSCEENDNSWEPGNALEAIGKSAALASFQVNPFSSSSFADELFGFSNQDAYRTSISAHSLHSVITGNSSSTVSTLPFPFYTRPCLPHVDDFVYRHELLYSNIRLRIQHERRLKVLSGQYPKPTADLDANPSTYSSRRLKSAVAVVPSTSYNHENEQGQGNLTSYQIEQFVNYVITLGERMDCIPSSSSTVISYQDMLTALRIHARSASKFDKGIDYIQDLLMVSFDDLLFRTNLTHSEWFDANSQGIAGEEYFIATITFNKSMRNMCKLHSLPLWSNGDLRVLRLHLSREGALEPTLNSVLKAVRKFYRGTEERCRFEAALPIINKIKLLMAQRKHRVMDFFLLIERDPSQAVSPRKLIASISHLLVSSESTDSGSCVLDSEIANTSSTTVGPCAERSRGAGLPIRMQKLQTDKLSPLSAELTCRITEMQAAIQARLNCRKSSHAPASILISRHTSSDQARTATVKFAATHSVGKKSLPPMPLAASIMTGVKHSESAGAAVADCPNRTGHRVSVGATHLSFNLSPSFQSVVESRTKKLVSSLEQYDSKRERNLNRLAAFF